MPGVFGDNSDGFQVSSENPLGIQAPDKSAVKPGEPEEQSAVIDNNVKEPLVEEGLNKEDMEQKEAVEKVTLSDNIERKKAFIRKKFPNGKEEFEKSIAELEEKLGKNREDVVLKSAEDAINYYIQLEEEQGKMSAKPDQQIDQQQQQKTFSEEDYLRQQVTGLQNVVQDLYSMLQGKGQGQVQQPSTTGVNQSTPVRDPQTGRFVSPNQNMQQNNNINLDNIDTEKFMEEFYEKGPNAEGFKKVVQSVAEQIAEQKFNQFAQMQQKQQMEQQQQQMATKLRENYNQQENQIKQTYGEQEYNKYRNAMRQIFEERPMYLNPKAYPNGFMMAFYEARKRMNNYENQQNMIQNQNQMINKNKLAADIPKSQSGQRFAPEKPSPEEIVKRQIFAQEPSRGIFG